MTDPTKQEQDQVAKEAEATAKAEADRKEAAAEAAKPRFVINELHPHSGSWNDQVERQNLEILAKQHNLAIGWKSVMPAPVPSPLAIAAAQPAEPASGPMLVEEETTETEVYGETDEKEAQDEARDDRAEDDAVSKSQAHAKKKKRA